MKSERRKLPVALGVLLAGWALLSGGSAVAQEVPTDGEVARGLVGRLLAPVVEVLEGTPGARGVAILEPDPPMPPGASVHEEIGNFLFDEGYEVWTIGREEEVPEGALVLDLEVAAAGIDYPRDKGGFLGLGRSSTLRRAALGVRGRLEDPRDGRWLWRGAPLVQSEQWVVARDRDRLAKDRPVWISTKPLPTIVSEDDWWERGLVAGLLAGVVILYFDGTQ